MEKFLIKKLCQIKSGGLLLVIIYIFLHKMQLLHMLYDIYFYKNNHTYEEVVLSTKWINVSVSLDNFFLRCLLMYMLMQYLNYRNPCRWILVFYLGHKFSVLVLLLFLGLGISITARAQPMHALASAANSTGSL